MDQKVVKPLVVVTDPDQTSREMIRGLLAAYFEVYQACILRETWEVLWQAYTEAHRKRRPGPLLLILEVRQPDGDGIEFLSFLQGSLFTKPT